MSEKSNVPRFFVASKLKNMVKSIPTTITPKGKNGPASPSAGKPADDSTIHSFHITESQQKPFMDCDALFADCEEFLKLSYRAIEINNNKGKSGLSKLVHSVPMSDKISKWQSRKKENELTETYESIQARAEQMDHTLNEIANVAAVSTSALITQSVHLNVRLTACVEYNRDEVDKNKPLVKEGRVYLNKLKSNERAILAMMDFMEEIAELKKHEPKPYVPWGMRQQVEEQMEAERQAALAKGDIVEIKRSSLEKRLKRIRKVRLKSFDFAFVAFFYIIFLSPFLAYCPCRAAPKGCRTSATRSTEQPLPLPPLPVGVAQLLASVSVQRWHSFDSPGVGEYVPGPAAPAAAVLPVCRAQGHRRRECGQPDQGHSQVRLSSEQSQGRHAPGCYLWGQPSHPRRAGGWSIQRCQREHRCPWQGIDQPERQ